MPSGFQQDLNQLQSTLYRVVITMSNTTYYPTTGGAENDRGGITPSSADSFSAVNLPTTLALSKNRARGNMRFRNVVNALSALADCQILDITINEANADAQAASLAFTVKFDRDTFMPLTGTSQGTVVVGNDLENNAMDTNAKVIKNEVAKAIRLSTTANMRVYDPDSDFDTQTSITATHTGATAAQTMGTVSVTLIDESTLTD